MCFWRASKEIKRKEAREKAAYSLLIDRDQLGVSGRMTAGVQTPWVKRSGGPLCAPPRYTH